MLRSEELKKLILTHQRRLLKLKEQQAVFGASVDPSVLIQIEDIETELARLREELVALPPDEAESDEIITPPVPATRAPKPLNLAEAKPHQGELPSPVTPSPPVSAPWPVKRWPWLAGGLMVIGVAVGLLGNQMGGQFFAAPTATTTAIATAIVEPTATATLTPSPEPFNPDTYPKGAVTQPVEVRLWAAPGCDELILDLEKQLRADQPLAELITSGEISLDTRREAYPPDTPPDNSDVATLDIWATCAEVNPTKIDFKLSETASPPPEVYSPTEVVIERSGNPLLNLNAALGLTHYQRREYTAAAERLASAARETDILGLLYGNSLLFQTPPQPEEADQFYKKAAEAYKKAIKPDTPPEIAAMMYNNRGVALLSQAVLVSGYETALQAFDQAIKLQSALPWPYFNRAYTQLYRGSHSEALADCEQVIRQATAIPGEVLVRSAGYVCQAEMLLMRPIEDNKPAKDYTPEIDRLLGNITPTDYDYPLPYYLRGLLSDRLDLITDAREQFACYVIFMQKRIKLPVDMVRIGKATQLLVKEHQPLTCLIRNDRGY